MENNEAIYIDTNELDVPSEGGDLYESRANMYNKLIGDSVYTATIVVQGYNRLEKTKQCVDAILRHTKGISYELFLVDNGSTDDTLEYFETVDYEHKKIIRITKNVGAFYPSKYIFKNFKGKYLVSIPNDVIVTHNWLSNIIGCYESDNKIGLVMPMSTNVSNFQEIEFEYSSIDELQEIAFRHNTPDPVKWKERMRLITIISVLKREIIDLVGIFDFGFFHDFSEDDFCLRIRRAGYKLILCEDTFIHHNHDFRNLEDKDPDKFMKSLEIGRQNYKEKHNGLDAWDDVINFEMGLINLIKYNHVCNRIIDVLGIDVRMGTPLLEIQNKLKEELNVDCKKYVFTTNAKYFADLQTICGEKVYCDRIDFLGEYFVPEKFDIIILGEPINSYSAPIKLLQKLLEISRPGGKILIKLRNTNDISNLLSNLRLLGSHDRDLTVDFTLDNMLGCLELMGVSEINIAADMHNVELDTIDFVKNILEKYKTIQEIDGIVNNICVRDYLICIEK